MIYNSSKDVIVRLTDSKRETFYECVNALTYTKNLINSSFEQGETKEGEIIFEVPEEALLAGKLYILS